MRAPCMLGRVRMRSIWRQLHQLPPAGACSVQRSARCSAHSVCQSMQAELKVSVMRVRPLWASRQQGCIFWSGSLTRTEWKQSSPGTQAGNNSTALRRWGHATFSWPPFYQLMTISPRHGGQLLLKTLHSAGQERPVKRGRNELNGNCQRTAGGSHFKRRGGQVRAAAWWRVCSHWTWQ